CGPVAYGERACVHECGSRGMSRLPLSDTPGRTRVPGERYVRWWGELYLRNPEVCPVWALWQEVGGGTQMWQAGWYGGPPTSGLLVAESSWDLLTGIGSGRQ
ncbi:Hypothetical predicted protein, partial [Pelobates cultripes]